MADSAIEIIRVSSWHELNEQLYEGSWNEEIRRYRSDFTFRGLSDASYEMTTSLMRLGGDAAKLEHHLLRNFRKYAHRDTSREDSVWNWLAIAQHHGLPTRLLDWTYSPYIAMHFATANVDKFNIDGVIWCVNYVAAHKHYLPVALLEILRDEGANGFTIEMLGRAAKTLQMFDNLAGFDFAVFFEPPSVDDRIVNQYAQFSMMSSPTACLDHWLHDKPGLTRKIIIPAELKWEVRDKLDQANITERVLFPGLDGLSRWLRRHYIPRGE